MVTAASEVATPASESVAKSVGIADSVTAENVVAWPEVGVFAIAVVDNAAADVELAVAGDGELRTDVGTGTSVAATDAVAVVSVAAAVPVVPTVPVVPAGAASDEPSAEPSAPRFASFAAASGFPISAADGATGVIGVTKVRGVAAVAEPTEVA